VILDNIAAVCALIIALSCFFILACSSPRAKIGMPLPIYIRRVYFAVATYATFWTAHKSWLAFRPDAKYGHTDVLILIWWMIQAAFFGLTAFSIWRRRLTPETWDMLQDIGLASRGGR